eukprot:jgi/Ulvmu1/400/UM001_0407.1
MSTRAAEKQLQSIIGGQLKVQKAQKGSKSDKPGTSCTKSVQKSSKAVKKKTVKSGGGAKASGQAVLDLPFYDESAPSNVQGQLRRSSTKAAASPNFMELMAQVGRDLTAISKQQQQAQSHHGKVLQLQGVVYHPPSADQPLLQDVSLELPGGSLGLVYGRSGAGKTTLLQLIAGMRDPSSGTVSIRDENGNVRYLDASGRQSSCGLVFQFPERHFIGTNLLMELAATTPASMASPEGYAARLQFQQRLPEALAAVGMQSEPWGRDPSKLSDGYKRRLALAVQLVRQPSVLLLDEPLAGLDWRARKDLVAVLKELKQTCSLLLVSHDLRELAPVVDCAWEMLPGGKLEARGKDIPVPKLSMTI